MIPTDTVKHAVLFQREGAAKLPPKYLPSCPSTALPRPAAGGGQSEQCVMPFLPPGSRRSAPEEQRFPSRGTAATLRDMGLGAGTARPLTLVSANPRLSES